MLQIINDFILIFVQVIGLIYISSKLLNCEINYKRPKYYIVVIILISILFTIKTFLKLNILISNLIFLLLFLTQKILFKQSVNKTFISTFVCIIISMVSETFLFLSLTTFIKDFNHLLLNIPLYNLLNVSCVLFACIITIVFKKQLNKLLDKVLINNELKKIFYLFFTVFLVIVMQYSNNTNIITFIINICIGVIILVIIIISFLEGRQLTTKSYAQNDHLLSYIKDLESIVENQRKLNHEYKNELAIIRQMIKNRQYKNSVEFINVVLDEKKECDEVINDLKKISSKTLKGFLYFKYNKMIEDNIKVHLSVATKCRKINIPDILPSNRNRDFYNLLGIILDNAMEAARDSEEKNVSIEIYIDKEENTYIINVSNTFNGEVDLDVLGKKTYTTKGTNHGVGLLLLNEILNKSSLFEVKRQIIKNVFCCEFMTKL